MSFLRAVYKKEFTPKSGISGNIFYSYRIVKQIVEPGQLYKLAENIKTVWICSKPRSIPLSNSVYSMRDFDN